MPTASCSQHQVWGPTEVGSSSSRAETESGSDSEPDTFCTPPWAKHLVFDTSDSGFDEESDDGAMTALYDEGFTPMDPILQEDCGFDPSNNTWSIGSERHGEGTCRPCFFSASPVGCRNGTDCRFCHMSHRGMNRPRPCKERRARYKKLIEQQKQALLAKSTAWEPPTPTEQMPAELRA
mmetsp:Transcript_24740/g.57475  ORF Transcript_24740/g.57475 Transcript_24740/m.57475 type:complete len:179 (-) Transcript_24740:50-586(-)